MYVSHRLHLSVSSTRLRIIDIVSVMLIERKCISYESMAIGVRSQTIIIENCEEKKSRKYPFQYRLNMLDDV